jgi:ABC-type uncharacterized transport system substrate-binding protein
MGERPEFDKESRHSAALSVESSAAHGNAGLMRNLFGFGVVGLICFFLALTDRAEAHPHVWVTMREELLYAPDGSVTGVRNAWTFDDMFSSFALQGIEQKTKGTFSRGELAPLAQVNVDSLKEYAYFTYAKVNGKRQKDAFLPPTDYFLDYDPKDSTLTLHFTLGFKAPVKAKALEVEIYDEEFFIDFGFAPNNPVRLVGAPAGCTLSVDKPKDDNFPAELRLDKNFATSEANAGMGADFSNKMSVTCQ